MFWYVIIVLFSWFTILFLTRKRYDNPLPQTKDLRPEAPVIHNRPSVPVETESSIKRRNLIERADNLMQNLKNSNRSASSLIHKTGAFLNKVREAPVQPQIQPEPEVSNPKDQEKLDELIASQEQLREERPVDFPADLEDLSSSEYSSSEEYEDLFSFDIDLGTEIKHSEQELLEIKLDLSEKELDLSEKELERELERETELDLSEFEIHFPENNLDLPEIILETPLSIDDKDQRIRELEEKEQDLIEISRRDQKEIEFLKQQIMDITKQQELAFHDSRSYEEERRTLLDSNKMHLEQLTLLTSQFVRKDVEFQNLLARCDALQNERDEQQRRADLYFSEGTLLQAAYNELLERTASKIPLPE